MRRRQRIYSKQEWFKTRQEMNDIFSDVPEAMANTLEILDKTHTELRRTAHHLMPEELLKGGLRQALTDFSISVPGAQFHSFGNNQRLGQAEEIVLYRCAYELVNNAIKHAEATHIDIQLMQQDKKVTLTVLVSQGQGAFITEKLQVQRWLFPPYFVILQQHY